MPTWQSRLLRYREYQQWIATLRSRGRQSFIFRHCKEAPCRRGSPDSYGIVSMSNGSPRCTRDDGGVEGR